METEKKKRTKHQDGIDLQNYLNNQPACQVRNMVKLLTDSCKVKPHIFANWRCGFCRIPELAKDKIEEIAGCSIFTQHDI